LAHRNLAPRLRVALRIAAQNRELDTLDLERRKRHALVPFRQRGRDVIGAVRLREHEPMRLVGEMRIRERLFPLRAVFGCYGLGALAGERHAERQCLLTLLDEAAEFFPAWKGGQGAWLDAARQALEERQELVPQRVVVEARVCLMDESGLRHRFV